MHADSNALEKPVFQDYLDKLKEYYETNKHVDTRWYTKIVLDCNKYIPNTLRHTYMDEITPEMLQEAINRVCRLGGKRYQSIVSGIRDSFMLASLDDTITVNPALSVHIREVNSASSLIDDDLYKEILKQVASIPGGHLFGLAGFADTTMESISSVVYEECDPASHTLIIRRNNKEKVAHIVDPDGIAVLNSAFEQYRTRMEDEMYACNNSEHLLCTNRFGMRYERRQLNTIGELLRDACNSPSVDIASFRKYIRYRQL